MVRQQVSELVNIGRFPPSDSVDPGVIRRQQELIGSITPPVSDEEARKLVEIFGPDDYFGLAWTVLHLVETAPGWPLHDCIAGATNEWILRLKDRVTRKR